MEIRIVKTQEEAALAYECLQLMINDHGYANALALAEYSREILQLPDEAMVMIAQEQGQVTGAITVGRGFSPYFPGFYGHVWALYVLPEFRRRGVATKLFAAARKEVKQRGWKGLFWVVEQGNEKALTFSEEKLAPKKSRGVKIFWLKGQEI